MTIAKITDTGNHIIVSCSATSATSVTDAGGVVNGTVSFDSNGMDTSAGGGISFTNMTNHEDLDYEGQIVMTVETKGICDRDDNENAVTFSPGVIRTAGTVYLFSARTSGASNMGYIAATNGNILSTKTQNADAVQTPQFNGAGRGSTTELCLWWKGTEFGYLIDGADPDPANSPYTRATPDAGAFYLMNFGAAFLGTNVPFEYKIKDIVVSRNAPRWYQTYRRKSIGVFGDSFATNSVATQAGERLDGTLEAELLRAFCSVGFNPRISTNGGHSGHTIATTGANDLEDYWDGTDTTFFDSNPQIVICLAGNNDAASSDAQVLDATNGTEKKYQEFITACAAANVEKVIISTAASMIGQTSLYTAANIARTIIVNNIVKSLSGWWDTNNPTNTGFVEIFDLYAVLEDKLGNNYYQGELNFVGNEAVAGTGVYDDRHPSGIGHKRIADKIRSLVIV